MARENRAVHQTGLRLASLALASILLAACSPQQSALHPAGVDAAAQARLFWVMAIAGAAIWCLVMGTAIYAVIGRRRPNSERFGDRFVFFGGVAFPTIVLALLLIFGLGLLPDWSRDEPPDLRVHVTAEQYWWRLAYEHEGGRVETANELHLPVNATVEFALYSHDVIHSFWIPALGGKMDAIPGRTNLLRLRPTKPGIYRGVCAEFCGPSHALMAFPVHVHSAEDFEQWLVGERQAAQATGGAAFVAAGCGACHIVRGVSEAGAVGPDLTHFARRTTIGAGTLPNTPDNLAAWLLSPGHIKPDVRMPSFASLPDAEREAIVAFLQELK